MAHGSYTFFHDALDRASPSGMECAYIFVLLVHQQHGKAVCGLDAKSYARQIGNQPVSDQLVLAGRMHYMDNVGMDLAQSYQRAGFAFPRATHGQQALPAVSLYT